MPVTAVSEDQPITGQYPPDGELLVSMVARTSSRQLAAHSGEIVATYPPDDEVVVPVAAAPRAQGLGSASTAGEDPITGQFPPDGDRLVSMVAPPSSRQLAAHSGEIVATYPPDDEVVVPVAAAPRAQGLGAPVTSGGDPITEQYPPDGERQVSVVARSPSRQLTAGRKQANVTVERKGETFRAEALSKQGAPSPTPVQQVSIDLDVHNSPSVRTFEPATYRRDGLTALLANVSNAPSHATFLWSVQDPDKGRFRSPNSLRTVVEAGEPGITTLTFEVRDRAGTTLFRENTWLGVPLFVEIPEFSGSYTSHRPGVTDSHLFDSALREFHLTAEKDFILRKAREVCLHLTRQHNIRTIWTMAPLGETMPSQFLAGNFAAAVFSEMHLAGYPRTTITCGGTVPVQETVTGATCRPRGARPARGVGEIYIGGIDGALPSGDKMHPEVEAILDEVTRLTNAVSTNPSLQPVLVRMNELWREAVGRFLGQILAHEIYHVVLGNAPGLTSGRHSQPGIRDLLSQNHSFEEATGIAINLGNFPAPGSIQDGGITAILELDPKNATMADVLYAIPPTRPFS